MVVGSMGSISIFSGVKEAKLAYFFSQLFEKKLYMAKIKSLVFGKIVVTIGKSNEAIICGHLGFMNTPYRPLARTFKPAADTLTARNRHRQIEHAITGIKDDLVLTRSTRPSSAPPLRGE